jgi:hypothetical protein
MPPDMIASGERSLTLECDGRQNNSPRLRELSIRFQACDFQPFGRRLEIAIIYRVSVIGTLARRSSRVIASKSQNKLSHRAI